MSAINKEKIYDELRSYHADSFPEILSSERMTSLREEFGMIEDKVISMLLGLVNGKTVYVDLSSDTNVFKDKVRALSDDPKERSDKNMFISKSEKLIGITALAEGFAFQLRKLRVKKATDSSTKKIV